MAPLIMHRAHPAIMHVLVRTLTAASGEADGGDDRSSDSLRSRGLKAVVFNDLAHIVYSLPGPYCQYLPAWHQLFVPLILMSRR